jgi:ribosomal protein S18 acetylase RimI-like enzyme
VRDEGGDIVGFAHVRACPRPLGGCDIGFLDDMFVAPEARGSGAADALFEGLRALAAERGWPALRWITQHFNERGRAFYDRYTAGPSDFIMYQWKRHRPRRGAGARQPVVCRPAGGCRILVAPGAGPGIANVTRGSRARLA